MVHSKTQFSLFNQYFVQFSLIGDIYGRLLNVLALLNNLIVVGSW